MEHDFIDKYAREDGFLQRLNPKLKVISALFMILLFVLTPQDKITIFLAYYLFTISLVTASKVPFKVIITRLLAVAPFIVLAGATIIYAGKQDVSAYAIILSKSILSVLTVVLLTSTTEFPKLLKALRKLGTPRIITMLLSFIYRYIFLLHDELMRIKRARTARTVNSNALTNMAHAGTIIGELFIRSFERSERVYSAMLARGFTGEF
ncbi:MAG: cobalt ECF transporter T component CbiQ [Candidatus Altiarchaeota archaeon]